MRNKIIKLSQELISIPSTQDNPQNLQKVIDMMRRELEGFTIEQFNHELKPSILVHNKQSRPDSFRLILNGHLDVVPAKEGQFDPKIEKNRLIGRGAFDMKSACAVLALVFKNTAKNLSYPLALQFVTDEEIGGFAGTKYQIDQGVRGDFVIAGENTNFNIIHQSKGILWIKLRTIGKSAHGAYIWEGENAIEKMSRTLTKILDFFQNPTSKEWRSTINPSLISSPNTAVNKVPDLCEISLDIRYIPSEKEKIMDFFDSILSNSIEMEVLFNEPSNFVIPTDEHILNLQKCIRSKTKRLTAAESSHGASDMRHYARENMKGVDFGPVGEGLHTDYEWVDIDSLVDYYNVMENFILSLD